MLEDQFTKAAFGLAFIIPGIFFLRWFLTRQSGTPEEWGEQQIKELERRFAAGEIDEESYKRRVKDIRDS